MQSKGNKLATVVNIINLISVIGSFILTMYNVYNVVSAIGIDTKLKIKNRNKKFGL